MALRERRSGKRLNASRSGKNKLLYRTRAPIIGMVYPISRKFIAVKYIQPASKKVLRTRRSVYTHNKHNRPTSKPDGIYFA